MKPLAVYFAEELENEALTNHRGLMLHNAADEMMRLHIELTKATDSKTFDPENENLRLEVARKEGVIERLTLDSKMLDYLERHPKLAEMHVGAEVTPCYYYAVAGAPGIKLREIIATAMKADPT